ncbi:MAG TPA: hypothetical protein VI248_19125 [Kineosporiaceae bacterium]
MSNAVLELGTQVARGEIQRLDDSLANVRNRALSLLSVATVVGSLAASLGLVDPRTSASLTSRILLAALLVPSVLIATTAWYTLRPVAEWSYGRNPQKFVEMFQSDTSEEECRKQLITQLTEAISENEGHVHKRTFALRVAVFLLVVQLALILVAVVLSPV